MPGFVIAFVLLAGVGIGGTLLAEWLNRDLHRITRAAEGYLRTRLEERSPMPMRDLILQSGVSEALAPRAERLLVGIGKELEVDPRLLRPDDRLDDLLRVRLSDLETITPEEWRRARLREYVDVFSYGLLDRIETLSDRFESRKRYASLPTPPSNEEEWVDFLMTMEVQQLLNFFAPIIRAEQG